MVCLWGRAIHENLRWKVTKSTSLDKLDNLDSETWRDFSTSNQNEMIYSYITFRRMVVSLLKDSATGAVDLLRTSFIGHLDTTSVSDLQRPLADFLAAEEVLKSEGNDYRIASAFIDSFVRRYVIPAKYPRSPSTLAPKEYEDGPLDILETLKMAIRFFDKELIRLAPVQSYKGSGKAIRVGGNHSVRVPRESVYDTELSRILTNWLNRTEKIPNYRAVAPP